MDASTLDALEFGAIRQRVARAAATEQGEAAAHSLEPSPDADDVAGRQALTSEAIALLDAAEEPPLDGIRDVREQASRAARGGALGAGALRQVADAIAGALRARASLEQQDAPLLREIAGRIDPSVRPLAETIDRAVEEDGSDLRDTASPRLRKLRAELRSGRHRVTEKMQQLVRSSGLREHLQEDFVTLRGGRPVLAVKASARADGAPRPRDAGRRAARPASGEGAARPCRANRSRRPRPRG